MSQQHSSVGYLGRPAGWPQKYPVLCHWYDATWTQIHGKSGNRTSSASLEPDALTTRPTRRWEERNRGRVRRRRRCSSTCTNNSSSSGGSCCSSRNRSSSSSSYGGSSSSIGSNCCSGSISKTFSFHKPRWLRHHFPEVDLQYNCIALLADSIVRQ